METKTDFHFDSLLPPEMAVKAEELGIRKANLDVARTFALAVLAGAFISLGAALSTTVATGAATAPYGWGRLLTGLSFSIGLVLVVVGGAELFTGNNLIVMAWASGRVTTARLLRNWAIVYAGNFVGALATAVVIYVSGQFGLANGAVGATALGIAHTKSSIPFIQAIALGVMCNALVCLAVWLSYSARSTADRMLAVFPPITAFVALGFEHSIANMYFIPMGLLIKSGASEAFWQAIEKSPESYPGLTSYNFLVGNLLPVTIGNVIGGALLVGLVYWFVYRRGSK
jgi:formate transporter FocA